MVKLFTLQDWTACRTTFRLNGNLKFLFSASAFVLLLSSRKTGLQKFSVETNGQGLSNYIKSLAFCMALSEFSPALLSCITWVLCYLLSFTYAKLSQCSAPAFQSGWGLEFLWAVATIILFSFSHSVVDLLVCLRSLLCCMTQFLFSLSR